MYYICILVDNSVNYCYNDVYEGDLQLKQVFFLVRTLALSKQEVYHMTSYDQLNIKNSTCPPRSSNPRSCVCMASHTNLSPRPSHLCFRSEWVGL